MSRKLIESSKHYQIEYMSAGSWWRNSKIFDDPNKARKYIKQCGNSYEQFRIACVETKIYAVK